MSPEKYKITCENVASLESNLEDFQATLHSIFKRREQRQHSDNYLRGLLYPLKNKSIETMMLQMHGDDENQIRAMQHFMSEGSWDDRAAIEKHWEMTNASIGHEEGVLIIDCSGFPKQGKESVGVKRQWCGQLGKKANCQVGVFAGYASPLGRTLLDNRLYLPKEWAESESYASKRKKCGVPEDITFKTKPQLAAEMVTEMATKKAISFQWITADEAYGRCGDFLDSVGKHGSYFAEIPKDTHVWLNRPKTEIPQWSGKGRKPNREKLVEGEPSSQTVAEVIKGFPEESWTRMKIKEGTKGPIIADMIAVRVVNSRTKLPSGDIWLVCRRNINTGEIHYFLSNASEDTSLRIFAKVAGMRWPIETCFEEGKGELGMGDYQLRSWVGWHHHMTMVILAHGFLMSVRKRLAEQAPKLTLPQVIMLLKATLPQQDFSLETTVKIVNYYQERHESAYQSHRKRRLAKLQQRE